MKNIFIILGFLLIANYTNAQCISGSCFNGFGTFKYNDGSNYEGFFTVGKLHGLGYFFDADGNYYIGEFGNGNFYGSGAYFWQDGKKHFGYYDGGQNGLGIYKDENDNPAAYDWVDGQAITEFVQTVDPRNPQNCMGNCVNGYGRITYADGSNMQAIFKDGKAVYGEISKTTSNYMGGLKNSVPEGFGILSTTNEHFIGYFKDGEKHGKGISTKNNVRNPEEWVNGIHLNPNTFKINPTQFCDELIVLAELSKKERETREVVEEIFFIGDVYKKYFLDIFRTVYSQGMFDDEDYIEISFPNDQNKVTLTEAGLNDMLNKCVNIETLSNNNYQYKKIEIKVEKKDYDTLIKLNYLLED